MASSTLSPLTRADGSTQYSYNGYSVLCAVNGPMEAQRREELPEEAVVDVAIRPATGVAGTTTHSSNNRIRSTKWPIRREVETS